MEYERWARLGCEQGNTSFAKPEKSPRIPQNSPKIPNFSIFNFQFSIFFVLL